MRTVAVAPQLEVRGQPEKLKALSWDEHIRAGHCPYRRDSRVCQETRGHIAEFDIHGAPS